MLKVFEQHQIPIDIIVGTSMGAMVGGAYAAGVSIERIEGEWLETDIIRVARNFLPTFPLHGWSSGSGVYRMLHSLLGDAPIEELPIKFAAVATDIETGEEVVIQEGRLVDAIRASSSVPGLFVPAEHRGRFLVDGGLVNPLPVDVARRLGAEIVVAVDVGYYPRRIERQPGSGLTERAVRFLEERFGELLPDGWIEPLRNPTKEQKEELRRSAPRVISVLILASIILQRRIVELNNKLVPPDVLIRPKLAENPPRYHSATRGIQAGEQAARQALEKIADLITSKQTSEK